MAPAGRVVPTSETHSLIPSGVAAMSDDSRRRAEAEQAGQASMKSAQRLIRRDAIEEVRAGEAATYCGPDAASWDWQEE